MWLLMLFPRAVLITLCWPSSYDVCQGAVKTPRQGLYAVLTMSCRMGSDFEFYEREYLDRVVKGKPIPAESYKQLKARFRKELLESARKAAGRAELDSWDYAALEMIRRGDMRGPMKFGTVRTCESFLKLYCHGLVRRLDRKPTFDEMERIQAFLDSPAFKQYESRLKRIMTKYGEERLALVVEILGIKDISDLMDLTDKGKEALKAKRAKTAALYEKMAKQYSKNRTDFYKAAPSYEWVLPTMVAMGLPGR